MTHTRRGFLGTSSAAIALATAGCIADDTQNMTEPEEWPPDVESFASEHELGDMSGGIYENRWYNQSSAAYLQELFKLQQEQNEILREIRDELRGVE